MKKLVFVFFIFQLNFLMALDINITMFDPDMTAMPGSYYYGSPITLNINNDTGVPVNLDGQIDQLLTSAENYKLPEGTLRWKGHWIDSGSFIKGYGSNAEPIPYLLNTNDQIAIVNTGNRVVTLGTNVKGIPNVQPRGRYTTRITFTVYD